MIENKTVELDNEEELLKELEKGLNKEPTQEQIEESNKNNKAVYIGIGFDSGL